MNKKLVSALLLFAGVIAFSPVTGAHARPHKHHSVHRTGHPHRMAPHGYRRGKHVARHARARGARGGRPAAWCGWWLGNHLGMASRSLWLARNWASVGRKARPGIGVVVVWRHHVGIITGRAGSTWIVRSGNDGHAVRERPRSIVGAIAFRAVSDNGG